jgi:hypothetical protein
MSKNDPQIIVPHFGEHNTPESQLVIRPNANSAYKDLSCVIVTPAHSDVPIKVVHSWMNLIRPPNQFCAFIATARMEVGKAYSETIKHILDNPHLQKVKYLVTLEHDNVPPPDGLVKLLNGLEERSDLSVLGGLYFTKGAGGVAQIWGNPAEAPLNFRPVQPVPGAIVECNGTGMGFTAYHLDIFRDERLRRPWFETKQEFVPGVGSQCYTQDLWFAEDARKYGYKFAVDCSVRVGHFDSREEITW